MRGTQPSGDLVERAIAAYFRTGGRAQPSNASDIETYDDQEYVVLRNINGVLAVYVIRPNGRLRRLLVSSWPLALVEEGL
jgi:hypothetical protein